MSHRTRTAEPPDLAGLSLEEVLQRAHARCALLADLFALHAVAPDDAQPEALSPAACTALAGFGREASQELRSTSTVCRASP